MLRAVVEVAREYLAQYLARHAEARRDGLSNYGPSGQEIAYALGTRLVPDHPPVEVDLATLENTPAFSRLAIAFGLSSLDLGIIAFLLAPELDPNLERAYAFAIDDFTKKRPDLGFVARVLGGNDVEDIDRVLRRFAEHAPLRRHAIVVVAVGDLPLISRGVRLADRIVELCRGSDAIDELVRDCVFLSTREPLIDDVVMAPNVINRVSRAFEARLSAPRLALIGADGVGRAFLVEALHVAAAKPIVRIDLAPMLTDGRIRERLSVALREVALNDGIGILEASDAITNASPRALQQTIADFERDLDQPLIFTLHERCGWLSDVVPSLVEIDVPSPTLMQRLALWSRALPTAAREDLEIVAARYAFTGGTIARVARRAQQAARLREPEARVTLDDLGDAARLVFSTRLGGMAQRIPVGFTWDDLVLPRDTLDGVREVVRFARHRPFLLEEWGFASKLPYGRGVSAILAGPPGTGKTMVAQLLAREIGYDLYRIDLSQVVNKYVGETEKNLARIFDEAEASHAVLFFDEADALFAKRTEVTSANDRYANLEVNYLLQRMETFDGVTLLATNIEHGLDDAVKRRVRFTVQFELPDASERARLWRSMFPAQVPLAPAIDWDTLGSKFAMAGGYIKKAAIRAALRAVDAGRVVTFEDLLEAANLEYCEMGRIV